MKSLLVLVLLATLAAPFAGATVFLRMTDGRTFSGEPGGFSGDMLVFRSGQNIEYRFPRKDIEAMLFPVDSAFVEAVDARREEDWGRLRRTLNPIFDRLAPYASLVREDQLARFYDLAVAELDHGNPYRGVAVAEIVAENVTEPEISRKLNDLILLGKYRLPIKTDVKEHAAEWVKTRSSYGRSALGWYLLAQIALDEERYDAALDWALQPVVFSSQFPTDYLGHCYAVAIAAATELEQSATAQRLREEMRWRALPWPETVASLAPYQDFSTETASTNQP